jgi:hypothetical protein
MSKEFDFVSGKYKYSDLISIHSAIINNSKTVIINREGADIQSIVLDSCSFNEVQDLVTSSLDKNIEISCDNYLYKRV